MMAKRYIDAEAALDALKEHRERILGDGEKDKIDGVYEMACLHCEDVVRYCVPTADVVERPRWISVDERLPETWETVLCWYEYYHYSRDKILPEYGIGYCINGRWSGEVSSGTNCRVLAWMPLPEPPKEIHND